MRTWEEDVLVRARALIDLEPAAGRMSLLEATAARHGAYDPDGYTTLLGLQRIAAPTMDRSFGLLRSIQSTGMPVPLALSVLSRERIDAAGRRSSGAWHSDHRLAISLAERMAARVTRDTRVVDPACGSGMLLGALVLAVCGSDRAAATAMISAGLTARDTSAESLRGACLTLASISGDLPTIAGMWRSWSCGDSLDAKEALPPNSFGAVIANPPWEKIKASRHEVLRAMGVERAYGTLQGRGREGPAYEEARVQARKYARTVSARFPSLRGGEVDLYIAFADLIVELLAPGGVAGMIVPGGLIRSKGTERLRSRLFEDMVDLEIAVHDNKAKHFSIDTRFKFLTTTFVKPAGCAAKGARSLLLSHAAATPQGVRLNPTVPIRIATLAKMRPDLTVPEVRTVAERELFAHLDTVGTRWAHPSHPMAPSFSREVDMSKARAQFVPGKPNDRSRTPCLPVIEGRMIQAHRFGAKAYRGGEGRAAKWTTLAPGCSTLRPQFLLAESHIAPAIRERCSQVRIGFCDIVGQTNERTLTACEVPAGVICGNKVPTIVFPNDPSEDRRLLFLAIANSFVFDWMVRRVVTTTVNYFVLTSLPMLDVSPASCLGRSLVDLSRRLRDMDRLGVSDAEHMRRIAFLRAKIDAQVAISWGCADMMDLILNDFPLIDRGQPAINREARSTITRDLIGQALGLDRLGGRDGTRRRVALATAAGAIGYLPNETRRELARTVCQTLSA